MAQYLIKQIPLDICHHINLFNLRKHKYKLVMNDLLQTYWNIWINKFKIQSNSNIYYYFLNNYSKYDLIYDENEYFGILLKEFKFNHIIYNNKLYHPIYESIYNKNMKKYNINKDSLCYSDTYISN